MFIGLAQLLGSKNEALKWKNQSKIENLNRKCHATLRLFISCVLSRCKEKHQFMSEKQTQSSSLIFIYPSDEIRSIQSGMLLFSCSVMSDSLSDTRLPWPFLEFAQIHVHWISDAIQPFHPLLLLPSIFPSTRVFSREGALCIRWPKDWSFSFIISPSNEYSGFISFRVVWP